MYRSAWERETAGIRGGLFAALGLCVLLAEMLVLYAVRAFVREPVPVLALDAADLDRDRADPVDVHPLPAAAPAGALASAAGRRRRHGRGDGSARARHHGLMAPLMTRYTEQFGLFGITIALIGWLLAASGVLVSRAAIGAEFDASRDRCSAGSRRDCGLLDPDIELPVEDEDVARQGLTADDVVMLVRVLANWMVMAAAVWVATALLPGIDVHGGFFTYLALCLLFGLVNAVVGPLLHLVALPLSVLTVGGSALVVNGVLLALTAGLTTRLDVAGLGTAVLGSFVISIVTTVLELVIRPIRERDVDQVAGSS